MQATKVTDTQAYQTVLDLFKNSNTNVRTDILEALIDAGNVKSILSRMSTVCSDKADHVRETWQDNKLARAWRTASNKIETCANALPNDAGIGYGD
jgi:hypothetical protein